MSAREQIADFLSALLDIYVLCLIAYLVLNMVQSFGVRLPYTRPVRFVTDFLRDVSEPLLRPFRRVIPPLGPIDVSPIVAILLVGFLGNLVVQFVHG